MANMNTSILTTTEEERIQSRKIRENYKCLITETREKGINDDDLLDQSFNQADCYFQEVSKPREAIYDSALVNLQSHIIRQKAQLLHTNLNEFKPFEFADKLITSLKKQKKHSPLDIWYDLGDISKQIIYTKPTFHFIYGSFEPGGAVLKKKTRKSRSKDELSNVIQRPKLVDAKESLGETQQATEEAEKILSILMKLYNKFNSPLCYFEFVINPHSFSETIENMFYVSILAKEAVVKISFDRDRLPAIEPIMTDEEIRQTKLHGSYTQSILSICIAEWKELVKVFQIKKPLIPTRDKIF